MKLKYLLFALILFDNNLIAQNFSQEFQNSGVLVGDKYAIQNFPNGYSAGITKIEIDNNFRRKIQLITTNLEGIIQSAKIYETTDSNYSITCSQIINLEDGKQLISGTYSGNNSFPYAPYIMLLNSDGSVNWAKKITSNRESPPKILLLSDNTFFLAFDYADSNTQKVFCKLDLDGNFTSFYNGNSLIYGEIIDAKSYESSFEILLATGDLINISNNLSTINWQRKYYNAIGITYNRTTNGDYIFASAQVAIPGYMTVFRTDSDGNLLWAKYIEAWMEISQNQTTIFDIVGFNFIKEDSNGNIITSANSEGGQLGSLNVVLDANGSYLANTKINSFQNKVLLLNDDSYLLGGFTAFSSFNNFNVLLENRSLMNTYTCDDVFSYSIAQGTDMQLIPDLLTLTNSEYVTDNFNVTFTSEIITQSDYCNFQLSSNENIKSPSTINIYPNPATKDIYVVSVDPISVIHVYNALGQEIERTEKPQIDIENYEQGVYFLKIIQNNNHSEVKKILKN